MFRASAQNYDNMSSRGGRGEGALSQCSGAHIGVVVVFWGGVGLGRVVVGEWDVGWGRGGVVVLR